jgi:Family of unknown function (DUF6502)
MSKSKLATKGILIPSNAKQSSRQISPIRHSGEISTDDLIRELLNLFDCLGLDPGQLVRRVSKVDRAKRNLTRNYPHASVIGDLLTIWNQDPKYVDHSGDPMPIRMKGRIRSFKHLAQSCAPNINENQLLLELKRLGAVRIDRSGLIHALGRTIPVYEDKRLAALHTLGTLHGFIRTLRHNLSSETSNSTQLFHRIAWNRHLNTHDVPRLKIWLKRHGQHFLESADNWMIRNARKSASRQKSQKNSAQISIGLYLAVDKSSG